jgi:hypothetical protein
MEGDVIAGPEHFLGATPTLGEESVAVAIGPFSIRFRGVDPTNGAALRERYAQFLFEGEALHEVTAHAGESMYLQSSPDGFMRMLENAHPQGEVLLSNHFAAFRPAPGGAGALRVCAPGDSVYALSAFENYLRWMVADLALPRGGFILHSAGLAREGKAYLFFGHSGAGKTTVCSLSPEAELLSDDLVLVLRSGDQFVASTTPFQGTLSQGAKCRRTFPLAGAFRLRQSSEVRVAPMPLGLAVGTILSCCPFVSEPGKRSGLLLPLVENFCRTLPVNELFFRKESSFWGVVVQSSAGGAP